MYLPIVARLFKARLFKARSVPGNDGVSRNKPALLPPSILIVVIVVVVVVVTPPQALQRAFHEIGARRLR